MFLKNYPCSYFNESDWGCTIASPNAIPSIKKPSPSHIKYMLPWHKLVCNAQLSLPEQVAFATKEVYQNYSDQELDTVSYNFEATQAAPAWVKLLDNKEIEEDDDDSSKLDEYMSSNNLYGIVYIQEMS